MRPVVAWPNCGVVVFKYAVRGDVCAEEKDCAVTLKS
jgi:hypothetical protein